MILFSGQFHTGQTSGKSQKCNFREIVNILNSLFVKWSQYESKSFLSSHLAIADRRGHELIRCS